MDVQGEGWFSSWSGETLSGELSTTAPQSARRRERTSQRVTVELPAALRQRGASGVSVQIMDLSTSGFRVATHLDLAEGTDVWLRMPTLEPCHAKVVWSKGHFVGCEFERPLHPAVLDMVVRNSGSR